MTTELTFKGSFTRGGGLLVKQGGSPYEEAVERGSVYHVANQATVVTRSGLSGTTPVLTIANPAASGRRVKMWYAGCASLVKPDEALVVWGALGGWSDTVVTGTAVTTTRNAKTGVTGDPKGIKIFLAATLPAAPVGVVVLGAQTTANISTSASIFAFKAGRWLDGALWVPPGFNFTIQTSTDTSLFCDYTFEVVDL